MLKCVAACFVDALLHDVKRSWTHASRHFPELRAGYYSCTCATNRLYAVLLQDTGRTASVLVLLHSMFSNAIRLKQTIHRSPLL